MVDRREKPRSIKKEKLQKQKWDVETTQCCSTVVYISLYVLQCLLQNWLQNINVTSRWYGSVYGVWSPCLPRGSGVGSRPPKALVCIYFFIFFWWFHFNYFSLNLFL